MATGAKMQIRGARSGGGATHPIGPYDFTTAHLAHLLPLQVLRFARSSAVGQGALRVVTSPKLAFHPPLSAPTPL